MSNKRELFELISKFIIDLKNDLCHSCSGGVNAMECIKLGKEGKCAFDNYNILDMSKELAEFLDKEGYKKCQ